MASARAAPSESSWADAASRSLCGSANSLAGVSSVVATPRPANKRASRLVKDRRCDI